MEGGAGRRGLVTRGGGETNDMVNEAERQGVGESSGERWAAGTKGQRHP